MSIQMELQGKHSGYIQVSPSKKKNGFCYN